MIEDVDAVDAWEGTGEPDDVPEGAPGGDELGGDTSQESPPDGEGSGGEEEEGEEVKFGQLAVPFGPFIALAALEYLLLGQFILPWLLF